ncbi:MAG: dihydrofolate reductase family protein [Gaiellaceae bacterium]
MGKLVVTEFITLDGVIEDPGGSEGSERGGWAFAFERGAEGDQFKLDELMTADAQLLGRKTYEGFAAAWPSRTDEGGFSDRMNSMPKYVVSTTLASAEWQNTTVVAGDLPGAIGRLKERYDGDILVAGSGRLVRSLLQEGLVDELRLMVFPVVLGMGARLFADGADRRNFELAATKHTGEVVILTLRKR